MKYILLLFGLLLCNLPIQAHDDVLEELRQVVKASEKYDIAKKEHIKTIYQKVAKTNNYNPQIETCGIHKTKRENNKSKRASLHIPPLRARTL